MRLLSVLTFALALGAVSTVSAATYAQFRTALGDIELELYDTSKPVTVRNFIRYVESQAYRDMFIHRWEPNFVIQGGGYLTVDRHTTNAALDRVVSFGQITNEFSVGRKFSNTYGTIAMARIPGQTNSATSEWFINLKDNSGLDDVDGGFTVFGRVIRGTNVLQRFNNTATDNGLFRLNLGEPLTTVPVLSSNPGYEDLLYVDITLLNVHVTRNAAGHNEISWNSVSNQVNRVEYTHQFPPNWIELIQTNGTGNLLQVVDPEPGVTNRFYRIRVDY